MSAKCESLGTTYLGRRTGKAELAGEQWREKDYWDPQVYKPGCTAAPFPRVAEEAEFAAPKEAEVTKPN